MDQDKEVISETEFKKRLRRVLMETKTDAEIEELFQIVNTVGIDDRVWDYLGLLHEKVKAIRSSTIVTPDKHRRRRPKQ